MTTSVRDTSGPTGSRHIGFLPVSNLHFPQNNREFFLSRELVRRGWKVSWVRPRTGTSEGVEIEWPVLDYRPLDVRGRTYFFPAYLAFRLRRAGIRLLWLSGWTMRDLKELYWLVRTLKLAGIKVIYDPVDPICEHGRAQGRLDSSEYSDCMDRARDIYELCDRTVSVTPEIRELLVGHGAPEGRTIVAQWGTDGQLFDLAETTCNLKQKLGLPPETFLAGWLGTMGPFKGLQEIVMPVVERAAGEMEGIHFVIAGRGPLENDVREWATAHPDLPVTVLSSIPYPEAPNFTGSLDAYLVPTNPDTEFAQSICPVKCFDALAMGTPLIVSRTRATSFLRQHEDLVTLVDFDPAGFHAALREWHGAPVPQREAAAVRKYTHQNVSVSLADEIEALHADERT